MFVQRRSLRAQPRSGVECDFGAFIGVRLVAGVAEDAEPHRVLDRDRARALAQDRGHQRRDRAMVGVRVAAPRQGDGDGLPGRDQGAQRVEQRGGGGLGIERHGPVGPAQEVRPPGHAQPSQAAGRLAFAYRAQPLRRIRRRAGMRRRAVGHVHDPHRHALRRARDQRAAARTSSSGCGAMTTRHSFARNTSAMATIAGPYTQLHAFWV